MKIDIAKRRRVMGRSRQLGHCICDPRRPCPCDVFTEQGLCPCAGERPDPVPAQAVRLTEMVRNVGCASKIAAADLEAVLGRLPVVTDANVLCGMPAGDDAGVYRLDGQGATDVCLLQTVDVMTPCVDDPRTFGRICAVNCLSDIYAMGGTPRTALSILAFPSETLSGQIMFEMMDGAMAVLAQAGVALIGGHSIKDEQIMLGFAITGVVDPRRVTARDAAKVGDVLVLTKPLGSGVLNFARQIGRGQAQGLRQAELAMGTLNRVAAEAMVSLHASACTDVTGFGLWGHLAGMVRHSHVTVRIDAGALPAFDGALQLLADGVVPGAVERNMEYVGDDLTLEGDVDQARLHLGYDAQTSGGLLIAMPESRCQDLLDALSAGGVTGHVIGRITQASQGRIIVAAGKCDFTPAALAQPSDTTLMTTANPASHDAGCCSDAQSTAATKDARRAFGALMASTTSAGELDERTKTLINLALVTLQRCGPCVTAQLAKARKLGVSEAQIDEAIWCAIAIGGACVKMFYDELGKSGKDASATPPRCC
ncbi:MAG: selenide, water dikinase SelD [Phycisphaeraceae bacterium]